MGSSQRQAKMLGVKILPAVLTISLIDRKSYGRTYLVETEDKVAQDSGLTHTKEHGADYADDEPNPYEQKKVKCKWEDWSAWSARTGCEKQSLKRRRGCKCSDGSVAKKDRCGGGKNQEKKEVQDECPNAYGDKKESEKEELKGYGEKEEVPKSYGSNKNEEKEEEEPKPYEKEKEEPE